MESHKLLDPNRSFENTAAEIYQYLKDTKFEEIKKLMEIVLAEYKNPNYFFQIAYAYSRSTRSIELQKIIDDLTEDNVIQTIATMFSDKARGWYEGSYNPSLLSALIKQLNDFDPEINVSLDNLKLINTCFLEQVAKPLEESISEMERKAAELKNEVEKLEERFLESAIMVEETHTSILENIGDYELVLANQSKEIIPSETFKQKKDEKLETLEEKLNRLIKEMNTARQNYDNKLKQLKSQQKNYESEMLKINEKLEQLHVEIKINSNPGSMQNTAVLDQLNNIGSLTDTIDTFFLQTNDASSISPKQKILDNADSDIIEDAMWRETIFDISSIESQKSKLDLLKTDKEKLEKKIFNIFTDRDRTNDSDLRKKLTNRFQGVMQNKLTSLSIFATSPAREIQKELYGEGVEPEKYDSDPISCPTTDDDEIYFPQFSQSGKKY